jgi:hypothetical protein
LAPGVYFRLRLIGFFEGVDSEHGVAWRVADSLSLRRFLGYGLDGAMPDHVTLSRTRRLLDDETHQAFFSWVLERLAAAGREVGAAFRAAVRDGRDAADTGARPGRSEKETAAASGGLQSGVAAADEARRGNSARARMARTRSTRRFWAYLRP